jgi:DNA-binding XRE family transcriptional regulator
MTPHDIKTEIYRRKPDGLTITKIAKGIGVTKQSVALVIERRMTSRRIAQGVAAALGLPFEQVFPEYVEPCERRSAACA